MSAQETEERFVHFVGLGRERDYAVFSKPVSPHRVHIAERGIDRCFFDPKDLECLHRELAAMFGDAKVEADKLRTRAALLRSEAYALTAAADEMEAELASEKR